MLISRERVILAILKPPFLNLMSWIVYGSIAVGERQPIRNIHGPLKFMVIKEPYAEAQ
jgi:hypothetical protein